MLISQKNTSKENDTGMTKVKTGFLPLERDGPKYRSIYRFDIRW